MHATRTSGAYVFAIGVAQEGLRLVPPRTHDWRLFIKPDEVSFLLQEHGFACDTAHFRGLAPTLSTNPFGALAAARRTLQGGAPPGVPLSDFVEVGTLEVQYMGWALRRAGGGEAADGG